MKLVDLESISTDIDYGITESATNENTGNKFLRITDIRVGRINWDNVPFCKCSEEDTKKFELRDGDIVFARTGSVGNTGLISNPPKGTVFASYLIRIRPNQDIIYPDYLLFYFQTAAYWRQIEVEAVGAIQVGLNATKLKSLKIPLPTLPEQQRIAAILQKADRLRHLRRYARRLSDTYLQSVFLEMFGDPARNEKGWEVVSLEEKTDFITSGSRGWAEYYSEEGDLFLRVQNLGANELLLDDVAYVQAPDNAESRRTCVKSGDLLISVTADIGRTGVIPDHFPTAYINQHLVLLRLHELNPYFVAGYFSITNGKGQILRLDREGVKSGLNFDDVKSLKVFNPPASLQTKFVQIVGKFQRLKLQQREAEHQSENLFQSLLQRAFQGEL